MAKESNVISSWSFLIGVVLALVFGFIGVVEPTTLIVLMVLGMIVGFLNVTVEEVDQFLISGAVLVIVASLGSQSLSAISKVSSILHALLAVFVPATLVVAVKNSFRIARN